MRNRLLLFSLLLIISCHRQQRVTKTLAPDAIDLSPTAWGDGVFAAALQSDDRSFPDNPAATGQRGAVTTTFHTAAAQAGLEALKQGGSSVDAAMTAALTQVALNAGAVISYFGIINMVHYDAASDEIVSMDATWNSVQDETDPMSIPGGVDYQDLFKPRPPSGRTALVGGFLKGVESAHRRYGKLPFAQLFQPAIYIAENGVPLSHATARYFQLRDDVLRRLPETKATLIRPDGEMYRAGDLFKQAALARTLRKLAAEGSDYMYHGAWGEKAVAAIRAQGGKMTMQDLSDYEVIWNESRKATYGEYDVYTLGPPGFGSVNLIEALNLAHAAEIKASGHWSESGASLQKIARLTDAYTLSYMPEFTLKMLYPDIDLSKDSRLTMETSRKLWAAMEEKVSTHPDDGSPRHSDTVIAIDQEGNMTAVTHSINCLVWGSTGIVVDGISIGDPASFQQTLLSQIQPGERLPGPIELGILAKNDTPVIPFASMSTGLHQQTVQSLLNIIMFDMDVEDAINAPSIFLPLVDYSNPMAPKSTVRVMKGAFPQGVLDASGLTIKEILAGDRRYAQGLWIGIHRDPVTGRLKAVSPPYATGSALAF